MLAKKKFLIINADDFNLTAGISRAICAAVDTGVVTSTSVFINEKATPYLKKVKAYHSLGIGLHFNITSGSPLSKPQDVKTLVTRRGTFLAKEKNCFNQTASADIFKELNSQFKKFCAFFGRMPTHIDSHHHVHYNKTVYNVIIQLAKQYRIPIRRRCRDGKACRSEGVLTTDYMYARFDPRKHWTKKSLVQVIRTMKKGVSELIVHPGFSDSLLQSKSSFNRERKEEFDALCSAEFQGVLRDEDIVLMNFDDLKKIKSSKRRGTA